MMTELFANHIKPDRTPDDLVAQVMLDWGLPLSLPIEQTTIAGKTVYKVAGNALYCCFDEGIDEAFVRALVEPQGLAALPLRIVFHDYAFANDTAKENVRQLLKQLSAETEMRVV
jgi:adenine-specific DNA-methyltransferase